MPWNIVGRTEQLDHIRVAVSEPLFGPLVITGEPGSGRSTMLADVLRELDSRQVVSVRVRSAEHVPFAALRPILPSVPDPGTPVGDVAELLSRTLAGDRGAVVALDDAHLADHASLLVLRALNRRGEAALVLTRPTTHQPKHSPDPTDCLRYEPGMRVVELTALTVQDVARVLAGVAGAPVHPAISAALHTASGGNPKALHDFVGGGELLDCIAGRHTDYQLCQPDTRRRVTLASADADRLVSRAHHAWRELALDQAEELCRLASWHGLGARVSTIAATTALLRGRPEQCAHILDTVAPAPGYDAAQRVLARAMCLGLGGRRFGDAISILDEGALHLPSSRERIDAYRAWLLAVTGQPDRRPPDLGAIKDREAALFLRAAQAAQALKASKPGEAVAHLRRALVAAAGCRETVPWMTPLLTACLIDALLLAGRLSEATELAGEFHAGKPGCGWAVAVAVSALVNGTLGTVAPRLRALEEVSAA